MTETPQDDPLETGVRDLLHQLHGALEKGDAAGAARCWHVPAFVVHGEGPSVLPDAAAVERYCAARIEDARLRGPGEINLRIESVEVLGDGFAMTDVVWSTPDRTDREPVRYGVQAVGDGSFAFCLALPGPDRRAPASASDATLTGALEDTFPASDPISAQVGGTAGAPEKRRST